MIATLTANCSLKEKTDIVRFLEAEGVRVQVSVAGERTLIGVVGEVDEPLVTRLLAMPGVEQIKRNTAPYPLVSREQHPEPSKVKVAGVAIGGEEIVVIAGPCSVESEAQILESASQVAQCGARLLRGGAFKPRSSPYSFQGMGQQGLELLAQARAASGLGIVTEVVAPEEVELVARYADMLQIGARNMQNFRLLAAAGAQPKPVLLKRGLMATVEELLMAAEYIAAQGNPRIVLCERGIRTFENATRNTLDVSAVPVIKERSHLPVIVDPSHAAGRRELVPALAYAAIAAGADGLIVEVHPDPDHALSDGRQSLSPEGFALMMRRLQPIARAVGRLLDEGTSLARSARL
jgi:3-deoxy-7-phosphoheptulonate synthase